jgi:hypothetical protein
LGVTARANRPRKAEVSILEWWNFLVVSEPFLAFGLAAVGFIL